jgi:hypothetical protein
MQLADTGELNNVIYHLNILNAVLQWKVYQDCWIIFLLPVHTRHCDTKEEGSSQKKTSKEFRYVKHMSWHEIETAVWLHNEWSSIVQRIFNVFPWAGEATWPSVKACL